jgi:hypothetical protein
MHPISQAAEPDRKFPLTGMPVTTSNLPPSAPAAHPAGAFRKSNASAAILT